MIESWDLVVDLSNITRDRALAPYGTDASLSRWRHLRDRLVEPPWSLTRVLLIADESLRHHLSNEQRQTLNDETDLRFEARADDEILRVAFGCGALVASHDNFDDFRRAYPEIQSSADRFIGWAPDENGDPLPEWRTMGTHHDRRLSRKEEAEDLRRRNLEDARVRARATATWFRCTNPKCFSAQVYPDRLPYLPDYDPANDSFCCSGCSAQLESVGNRAPCQMVVVYNGEHEIGRLLVEAGEPFVVGREDAVGLAGLSRSDRAFESVSRRHIELSLVDGKMWVRDLGSANGASLQIRHRSDIEKIGKRPVRVGVQHQIRLPNGVRLEVSARRAPITEAVRDGRAADDRLTIVEPDQT